MPRKKCLECGGVVVKVDGAYRHTAQQWADGWTIGPDIDKDHDAAPLPRVSAVGCPACKAGPGEPCVARKPPPGTEPICKHPPEKKGFCCFHGVRYGALDEAERNEP